MTAALFVAGAPTASAAILVSDCGDSIGPVYNIPATGDCWRHISDPWHVAQHPCDVFLFLGKPCTEY